MKTFDDLVNSTYWFYGVDSNQFKLNEIVWEAIEDEDDGYRSYLDSVVIKNSDGIFQRQKLAKVRIKRETEGDCEGYKLVGVKDGWVWLRFGTDYTEDYYPMFVFEYKPKPPKSPESEKVKKIRRSRFELIDV